MVAYIIGLFVASALALPCWSACLRGSLGRFLTVKQIHIVEYTGLGGVAVRYLQVAVRPWRSLVSLCGILAMVGFLDELFQGLLPQRFFQWSDVILNWVGTLVGLSLFGVVAWLLKFCKPEPSALITQIVRRLRRLGSSATNLQNLR